MGEEEIQQREQERQEQWEMAYIRKKEAAADILRYLAGKKFTVDDAQNTLDMAGRLVTAAATVNADETVISELLL